MWPNSASLKILTCVIMQLLLFQLPLVLEASAPLQAGREFESFMMQITHYLVDAADHPNKGHLARLNDHQILTTRVCHDEKYPRSASLDYTTKKVSSLIIGGFHALTNVQQGADTQSLVY